ncbi:MAG TPA: T9SS type A sorting domain-containing protein [Chitinophagales bacterium]|nr:T9SS type A sorting domain-containing protein [Chitinophagales bacterium]
MISLFPIVSTVLLLFASISSFSQSGQWAWMKGDTSSIYNAFATWGTQGVANVANTPAQKYSAYHWQDTAGNFWIYSGITKAGPDSGYNDLWKFDVDLQSWIWMHGNSTFNSPPVFGIQGIPSPLNTPGFRYFGGLSWTDFDGNFWLYSGTMGGADLWKYDPAINEWTWMQGSQSVVLPSFGTYQVASATNTPGWNVESDASWVDDQGNLWFFGGSTFGGSSDVLWKYDLGLNQWIWMSGDTTIDALPVYGTMGVPDPANTPGARRVYCSWKDANGNFMIFGGANLFSSYNDVWKYDLASGEWTWMSGDSLTDQSSAAGSSCIFSTSTFPGARFENRARATDSCGNVWMYGGHYFGTGSNGDLWNYRSASNDWAWITGSLLNLQHPVFGINSVPDAQNTPGQRSGNVMWFDKHGNIWLFAGFGGAFASGKYTNQLWKYIPDAVCMSNACLATSVDAAFTEELKVYPNPSSGIINIEIPSAESVVIEIRNVLGQLVFSSEEKNSHGTLKKQIDLSGQTSGICFLVVKNGEQQRVKKIFIE